jgi:anti-sigma factor RsiW
MELDETHAMNDQLVAYLLGALEFDETRQVERNLAECTQTRRRLEIFRRVLVPLENIDHAYAPGELAARTCDLIRMRRERNQG